MTRRFALLGLLALLARAAAVEQADRAETLQGLMERRKAEVHELQSTASDARAAIRERYKAALEAGKTESRSRGKLAEVPVIDAESERLHRDLTPAELTALPALIKKARAEYERERAMQAAQYETRRMVCLQAHQWRLENLEKRLTESGDLDAALAVRQERTTAAAELAAVIAARPILQDLPKR